MRARAWLIAAVAALSACVPPPPGPAPSRCALGWGSGEQANRITSGSTVVNVRAGVHKCFDRMVVDLVGSVPPGHAVRYVDTVTGIASGEPIPLRGGAFLEVVVWSPAYDEQGVSTYPKAGQSELVDLDQFATFEQIAWGGSFEAITLFGVGVRAQLPFRVFTIVGPGDTTRLVVDVAHGRT